MERLGVNLGDSRSFGPQDLIEIARVAEAAGFESFFIGEVWGWDINQLLALTAVQTSRIRLGANIHNIFARTPGALAQSAASLDILSGGRAIVGLGIATRAIVQDWHGVPFDRPAQRLRETVEILRQALGGQRLDYSGEIFRVQRFRLTIEPVQARIPIYLATNKPANVALTGELADGWSPANTTPTALPDLIEHLHRGAQAAGRDPDQVTVAPSIRTLAADDPEPARQLVRRDLAYYLGSEGSLHYLAVKRSGFFLDELERIKSAFRRDPPSADQFVTDEMVDAFTIVGTPAECRQRIAGWRAAGATLPIIRIFVGASLDQACQTLDALRPGAVPGQTAPTT